jgi:hypothetical protein
MKSVDPRTLLTTIVLVVPIAFTFCIVAATMPQWWIKINFENTPMSWLQSTILSTCAFLLLLNTLLLYRHKAGTSRNNIILYAMICCAFALLSLDEAFQIHERIRGGLLQPNHIGTSLPFIGAGDIVLPLYAFFGTFLACFFLKSISRNKKASLLFKLGFIVSVCAVIIDTIEFIPKSDISSFRVIQFAEELLELCAQSLFLSSFADLTFCNLADKNICDH